MEIPAAAVTTVSADGTRAGYAYPAESEYVVGMIDLTTGTRLAEHRVQLLTGENSGASASASSNSSPGTEDASPVPLKFSGDDLVLFQTASGDDEDMWALSVFRGPGDPISVTDTLPGPDMVAELHVPTGLSVAGPIVTVTDTMTGMVAESVVVDPATGDTEEFNESTTRPFTGCAADTSCDLPVHPVARTPDVTIDGFDQEFEGRDVCGAMTSTGSTIPCARGFATEAWTSQDPDVVPEGADPITGRVAGVGDGIVVGTWTGETSQPVFRTINVDDPSASHGLAVCDTGQSARVSTQTMTSPSGQYVTLGGLLFDTETGEGTCLQQGQLRYTTVTDDGMSWMTDRDLTSYTDQAAHGGVDGTTNPIDGTVAVPVSILEIGGREVGVFIVSAEQRTNGYTVFAAYPLT